MVHDQSFLQIPNDVVSRIDVGRLVREVEALDEFVEQAAVRKPGTSIQMPRTSKMLDEMLEINKLNALVEKDRMRLLNFLITVRAKAPVIHMSFSADPSPLFTQKLIIWLREHVHSLVLLQIGLQPNIGAGTVVRTTNKYFDMSLRKHFGTKHELLVTKIRGQNAPAKTKKEIAP